jgi:hypothetical protein
MNGRFVTLVRRLMVLGACLGGTVLAVDIYDSGNEVFDLYFFNPGESGMLGAPTGESVYDTVKTSTSHVANPLQHYWTDELKQAMVAAVNTWTSAIANPYDDSERRKLRIGFFLDDGSPIVQADGATVSSVMDASMAGYARTQTVVTNYEAEYGTQANIYSIAEWAWRDNNPTSAYNPSWAAGSGYWESELLPDVAGANCVDIIIVLNPLVTSSGWDAQGMYYYTKTERSVEEMQNIATHELAHGLGMDSWLYKQSYNAETDKSEAVLSGYVSTWDSLLTLEGEDILMVENGKVVTEYSTLAELHQAAWEEIPANPDEYTYTELQYDPNRRLSLEGEVGVHVASIALEGDTLEHISYGDGTNVLGPGGTANSAFSETDLRTLELLGWSIRREVTPLVPEPTTAMLSLLALAGLAMRRRRK